MNSSNEATGRWLDKAGDRMWELLVDDNVEVERKSHHTSIGFPRGGRNPIGQAWPAVTSSDKIPHVYIHPKILKDTVRVLSTLMHELIHVSDDCKSGHRGYFRRAAIAVGLTGKMTETEAGPELQTRLECIAERLGPCPIGQLSVAGKVKKQSTRMVLAICDQCRGKLRGASKTLDAMLPATCYCGGVIERDQIESEVGL